MDAYFKKTRPRAITNSPIKKPLLKQPVFKPLSKPPKCRTVLFPKKTETKIIESTTNKTVTKIDTKIEDGPLKGISTSLLEFVRAKEAKAKETTPEKEREKELLGIVPEIARIVPTIFTASKREIILHDKIVNHCCKSLKMNYTTNTIEECLILMDKITPEWTSTVTISRGKFMRFNRDKYTIPQLLEAIKKFKKNTYNTNNC